MSKKVKHSIRFCPLIKSKCYGQQCAWFGLSEHAACALYIIASKLFWIEKEIQGVRIKLDKMGSQ